MWIALILENFSLCMFISAFLWALIQISGAKTSFAELLFRRMMLLGVGIAGIYGFIMHAFFGELAASQIGWASTPFQYEVAIANLAIGVIGVMSFWENLNFCLAAAIATCVWFLGDACGHVYHIFADHNYSNGNAGSWLWTDILIPIALIFCLIGMRKKAH